MLLTILGDFPEALSIYPKFSVQRIEVPMDACIKRKFSKTNRKAFELLLLHCSNQLDKKLPYSNCTRSPFPFYCPFVPSTEVRELVIQVYLKRTHLVWHWTKKNWSWWELGTDENEWEHARASMKTTSKVDQQRKTVNFKLGHEIRKTLLNDVIIFNMFLAWEQK